MDQVTIYHNPRCSKSRQALAILSGQGIEPEIVLYLQTPPTETELRALLKKLGLKAEDILRKGEDEYISHIAPSGEISEDQLISLMVRHPKVIERPIICKGEKAVIGRPPEKILSIL